MAQPVALTVGVLGPLFIVFGDGGVRGMLGQPPPQRRLFAQGAEGAAPLLFQALFARVLAQDAQLKRGGSCFHAACRQFVANLLGRARRGLLEEMVRLLG